MKRPTIVVLVCVAVGAVGLSYAQDRKAGTGDVTGPGAIAAKILKAEDSGSPSWQERDESLRELNRAYAEVRAEVVRALSDMDGRSKVVPFGGRHHYAMQVAGAWGVEEARRALAKAVGCHVDPSTIPDGWSVPLSGLYPAAQALTRLPAVEADVLFAQSSDEDVAAATWVLATSLGRVGALGVLKEHLSLNVNRPEVGRFTRALELLQKTTQVDDLLPAVLKRSR